MPLWWDFDFFKLATSDKDGRRYKMASLLDGMTREQKLKFLYIDLVSRNLVDEKTAEENYKKMLKELEEKERKKPHKVA